MSSNKTKILYEDANCIVFDKPSGLLVIPTPKNEKKTLVNIVNDEFIPADQSYKLHPCHRLDRDTSGAILFAKGKKNQKMLMDLFHKQEIKKKYVAFVQGHLKAKKGEIRKSVKSLDRHKFNKHSRKSSAVTRYKVIEQRKHFSIIEVEPQTGRSNQIRIHFKDMGHPIVGDRKYSIVKNYPTQFKRTALHAQTLQWIDPFDKKKHNITSDLPNDMEVFLARN